MNYDFDLIIIGAGPAGSTMAIYAANNGLKTLLIDRTKFPRDKVCGDAIPPESIAILQELNLLEELLASPHVYTTINWHTEYESLQLPHADALVCQRSIFDSILFQKAKSLVQVYEGWKVDSLLLEDGQIFGVKAKSTKGESLSVTAKIVAGADGCNSVIARKLGLNQVKELTGAIATSGYYRHLSGFDYQMELYYLTECLPGYLWLFPVDQETVNVGVLLFDHVPSKNNLSALKLHRQLLCSPMLRKYFLGSEIIGDIRCYRLPLATTQATIHGNGFILAGDAASLIDPFMGHGIDTAMISGKIAGQLLGILCHGQDYSAKALQIYADTVWQEYGAYFQHRLDLRNRFESSPPTTRMSLLNAELFAGSGIISQRQIPVQIAEDS